MLTVQDVELAIGGAHILNGVSFEVGASQTLGVIGPNGSGKTTLFNCLSGFLLPQSGKVQFRGKEITHTPPHVRARLGLGRVFQSSGVFRELTVLENMIVAIESQPNRRSFFQWGPRARLVREEARSSLELIRLEAKASEKAANLSGGQLRLLEIARAIAFGAEMLLLDEPTAGVSPKMKDEVAGLIQDVRSKGKAIIVIEHDLNFIEKFCDRVLVLDIGKVVLDGTASEVRQNPMLQEIYFGK